MREGGNNTVNKICHPSPVKINNKANKNCTTFFSHVTGREGGREGKREHFSPEKRDFSDSSSCGHAHPCIYILTSTPVMVISPRLLLISSNCFSCSCFCCVSFASYCTLVFSNSRCSSRARLGLASSSASESSLYFSDLMA